MQTLTLHRGSIIDGLSQRLQTYSPDRVSLHRERPCHAAHGDGIDIYHGNDTWVDDA